MNGQGLDYVVRPNQACPGASEGRELIDWYLAIWRGERLIQYGAPLAATTIGDGAHGMGRLPFRVTREQRRALRRLHGW